MIDTLGVEPVKLQSVRNVLNKSQCLLHYIYKCQWWRLLLCICSFWRTFGNFTFLRVQNPILLYISYRLETNPSFDDKITLYQVKRFLVCHQSQKFLFHIEVISFALRPLAKWNETTFTLMLLTNNFCGPITPYDGTSSRGNRPRQLQLIVPLGH